MFHFSGKTETRAHTHTHIHTHTPKNLFAVSVGSVLFRNSTSVTDMATDIYISTDRQTDRQADI